MQKELSAAERAAGSFLVVFPDLPHRSRVPEKGRRRSIHIPADPNAVGSEEAVYTQMCPVNPVIRAGLRK